MTLLPSGILFAISSADERVTQRAPKQAQRALAENAEEQLLASLGGRGASAGELSRSHSRQVALVAASWDRPRVSAGVSALGADIEFADPRRGWREIAFTISELKDLLDPRNACRAWTLCEAWYKAFGAWPVPALVRRALRLDSLVAAGETIVLAGSTYWARSEPVEGFQASIVWRGTLLTPERLGAESGLVGGATNGSAS